MSEVNTGATEQSVLQSIEELGGIPTIELEMEVSGMTAYPTDKTLSIQDMAADAAAVGDAINDLQGAIADTELEIAGIEAWTANDIPMTNEQGSQSIAEAIDGIIGNSYPVGTIYMTISSDAPALEGTWVEVAISATFTQIKAGKHGYRQLESGETGGPVHFWLRTA